MIRQDCAKIQTTKKEERSMSKVSMRGVIDMHVHGNNDFTMFGT